jgi:hypothetical protein
MKSPIIKTMVVIAILSQIIFSCSSNQPNISNSLQDSFKEMIPINDINTHFHINIINNEKHKFGSDVNIVIENISDKPIYFSADAQKPFARIFVTRNNKWSEIQNKNLYFALTGGEGSILFPSGSDQPNLFTTSVRPALGPNVKDLGSREVVRILVSGELMSDGKKTGILTGAYVDLFMEP